MMAGPIDINEPQEGFYRRRLVRGGPWVPARIWWVRGDIDPETGHQMSDDVLHCLVNGKPADPYKQWIFLAGHRLKDGEAEYLYMVNDAVHAKAHRPDDAKANPHEPIDLGRMKPVF